jgi:uncharacterized membrane protein
MQKARQVSLYTTIILWALILGGSAYAHVVYFPPYLSHLPASNQLISGEYGLKDSNFWMLVHPFAIVFTITALVLNWKIKPRRKFILGAAIIYGLAILFTALYFVPELLRFAEAGNSGTVNADELFQRGQTWQYRSWVRGIFLVVGFVMLVIANGKQETKAPSTARG